MGKRLLKWYFVLQIEPGTKKIKELGLSKGNVARKMETSIVNAVGESMIEYRKRTPKKVGYSIENIPRKKSGI